MGCQRLRHDAAYAAATALLDMVCRARMPTEHKDLHEEAYHIVLAALEADDIQREREAIRLCMPSRN